MVKQKYRDWETKMVQRLVSADTLKKAEVKVGLKSDREVQLESENELLKAEIAMIKTSENKEIVLLESENAGLRLDRDDMLKMLNTVKHENETLKTHRDFSNFRFS